MIGRELTITERRMLEVEKALTILHWGIRKASRYTSCNHPLTLVLRSPELKILSSDSLVHSRLRAKFIDLSAYNITYAIDESSWNLDG